jgi:TRAP-type C4-dicarboxylate transport system permease small subunit
MEQPANTVSYFIAGYVIIFGAMLAYLISLIVRWRNLRQDESLLTQLEAEQHRPRTDE